MDRHADTYANFKWMPGTTGVKKKATLADVRQVSYCAGLLLTVHGGPLHRDDVTYFVCFALKSSGRNVGESVVRAILMKDVLRRLCTVGKHLPCKEWFRLERKGFNGTAGDVYDCG